MVKKVLRSSQSPSPSLRYPSTPLHCLFSFPSPIMCFFPSLKLSKNSRPSPGRKMPLPAKHGWKCLQSLATNGSLWPFLRHEREPKPKLLSPDIFWWGGGLPREGVGAKKFGMSLETQGYQTFFGRISRDFAGISRKRPKSLSK